MNVSQNYPAVESPPRTQQAQGPSSPDLTATRQSSTLNDDHREQEDMGQENLNRPLNSTSDLPDPHPSPSDDPTPDRSGHRLPEKEQKPSKPPSLSHEYSIRRVPLRKPTRGDHLGIARANVSWPHLKPLIKPLACLIGGCVLAVAHHVFNSWADGRPINPPTRIPQVWMLRIGTAFAFAFKTILAASLSFVICQLLWFSTRRKYLTVQDIDTLYSVERRDIMSTVLSNAVLHGPLLVGATILSFMLPIAAVFTPASLGVRVVTYAEDAPCVIAAGNFKYPSDRGVPRFSHDEPCFPFDDVTAVVARISEITFASGAPNPLPEFCGKNCTYKVNVDSMAFKCEQGVALPFGHMGEPNPIPWMTTFWNATAIGDQTEPTLPIYVGWATGASGHDLNSSVGTSGSAYCVPVSARYEFTVRTINGAQSVSYNVTTFDQLPPASRPPDQYGCRSTNVPIEDSQIGAVAQAVRRVLLGSIWVSGNKATASWNFNSTVRVASFLTMRTRTYAERSYSEDYIWKDVVKGIEETAANITASLLNLDDGRQNSTCSYSHSNVVYDYNPANLLAPYGVAVFVVAVALVFGVFVFLRFNPDDLTTSFADTISITRTKEMDTFARKQGGQDEMEPLLCSVEFRLSELPGGNMGYGTKQDF